MKFIDTHEIAMIAAVLSENWFNELYTFSNSHGIGYIDAIDEIANWTQAFYNAYYKKMENWEKFEESKDNIYKAVAWDDFVIAWGADQLKEFRKKHSEHKPL